MSLLLSLTMQCETLETPPESLQVAWVSPIAATAGRSQYLPVMRVSELRKLADADKKDPGRLLQRLGMLGKKQKLTREWKVTIFDVKRDQLCRPVSAPEGSMKDGMAVCPTEEQRKGLGIKASGWSGQGWLQDTVSGARSLDLYRIPWAVASSRGFCVLPWSRFVGEG